jgi:hypothetical protein
MHAYYLDDRLSLEESTCRFPSNGKGRETNQERFYVVAIRRTGSRECLFRFSEHDRADARPTLDALNRTAAKNTF